jgi:hypothetical protein
MDESGDDVSYYDLLCIAKDATPEEIKKAYRRYSTVLHPDKQPDAVLKGEASAYFVQIKEAYEVRSSDATLCFGVSYRVRIHSFLLVYLRYPCACTLLESADESI